MYDAGAYVLYNLHRLPVMQKFSTSIRSPYYFDTFASYATALAVFRKREPPEYNLKPLPSLKSNPNSNENLASFAVNGSIRYTVGPESVKVKSKPVAVEPPDNTVVQDRRSGVVFFGSQTILSLEDAKRIRSERAAEARVTDPALIALFARSYRCPNTVRADDLAISAAALASLAVGEDGEVDIHRRDQLLAQQRREQMYHLAQRACQSNLEVAMSAGLHCRVAVWTTLLSLLPVPDPRRADRRSDLRRGRVVPSSPAAQRHLHAPYHFCRYLRPQQRPALVTRQSPRYPGWWRAPGEGRTP
jgi:hypothetical protein